MLGSAPAINLLSSSIVRSRDKRRRRKIPIAGIARPFPLSNDAAAEHQRAIKQLLLLSKGIRERRRTIGTSPNIRKEKTYFLFFLLPCVAFAQRGVEI